MKRRTWLLAAVSVPMVARAHHAEVGVLGFTFSKEQGEAVVRAEYLFVDGKAYGLRWSPV